MKDTQEMEMFSFSIFSPKNKSKDQRCVEFKGADRE